MKGREREGREGKGKGKGRMQGLTKYLDEKTLQSRDIKTSRIKDPSIGAHSPDPSLIIPTYVNLPK